MNLKSAEKKEKSTLELVIEVGQEEFDAAVDRSYRKNRGSIHVHGFRKGKAPRKIIERMYGASIFYEDAMNEICPAAYAKAVEGEKLEVIGYPDYEVLEVGPEGLTFKALTAVYPEVKLGEYKGLSAVRQAVSVTQEDIDQEMQPLIQQASRLVPMDRPVAEGDTVVIDFEGVDENGVPFEGGKSERFDLVIGSGQFVPGFEEQLIGMEAGEERDIPVTFPENYIEQLAGKPVVFHVKLHEVKGNVAPVLDDEFAKDVSEYETLDELKNSLKERLIAQGESKANAAFEDALMQQVVAQMEADIPDAMVELQTDTILEELGRRLQAQGVQFQEYLSVMQTTPEKVRAEASVGARRQVEVELALRAVTEAEDITLTDEEIQAEYQRVSDQYQIPMERLQATLPQETMTRDLKFKKAMALIVETATPLTEEPAAKPKRAVAKSAQKADGAAAEKSAKRPAKGEKKTAETGDAAKAEAPQKRPSTTQKTPAAKKAVPNAEKGDSGEGKE